MATLQKDIQNILDRIDDEIIIINSEFDKVGQIVDNDLDSLYNEYIQKTDNPNLDKNQFKEKYRDFLGKKKLESLNVARDKLLNLKKDISLTMAA